MIEVEHISKSFGSVQAVRDVSFRVEAGETLGFLGPNGAGKTTTMRILTGFHPASGGKARVGGLDVFEDSLAVRRKLGYLPENVPLYPEMTAEGYLRFVAEIKGVRRKDMTVRVGEAMEMTGIESMKRRRIGKLSKGYRQRVGLAQALIGDPEVLILDEPTIGLDPRQINEIRNVIKSFAGRKTVILSTHILPEVSMTCQKVVIINQGRVVAEGTPENLSTQLSPMDRVRLTVDGPADLVTAGLRGLNGVTAVEPLEIPGAYIVECPSEVRPALASKVLSSGWSLHEMTPLTATLEDVFLNLVTREMVCAEEGVEG